MDEKLAKAIEFIKLLRWQYPLPSKLDEIDKFVFECGKEAAEQRAHPTDCTCPRFENGSKVFPMRECAGCRQFVSR